MRILLLLNGPRERYVGGADTARQVTWGAYCSPGTELTIGYLPPAPLPGELIASAYFSGLRSFGIVISRTMPFFLVALTKSLRTISTRCCPPSIMVRSSALSSG
jgi:hypothetical protein